MPLLLNQLLAVSVRIVTPSTGVWFADVDYDLDETQIEPFGPVLLTLGTTVLQGTIDPRGSGRFGMKAKARVVGGGAGWDQPVKPQHFNNPAGVLSTMVRTATALEVGEVLVDATPSFLGTDFVRAAGPASQVLAGVEWWVSPIGVTIVGPRLPLPMSPLVDVLSWDGNTQCAELASDELVLPGTILVDLRFGTATIRDVEQVFDQSGARATAWCGDSAPKASKLVEALKSLSRHATGIDYVKVYRYRVVAEVADKFVLQAVDRPAGMPDVLPISIWPSMAGDSVQVVPGTECLVEFIAGDPSNPIVRGFKDGAPPITRKISALTSVTAETPLFLVGLGLEPVAKAPEVVAAITAIAAWIAAVTALAATPPTSVTFTLFGAAMAAPGATVAAAVAALLPTIPSTNTMVD